MNDLVNYKLSVENIRAGQLKSIADVLNVDLGALYDMCVFKKAYDIVPTSEKDIFIENLYSLDPNITES